MSMKLARKNQPPAGAYAGQWLQSFREFPARQKPGSFNLDRVMETRSKPQGSGN